MHGDVDGSGMALWMIIVIYMFFPVLYVDVLTLQVSKLEVLYMMGVLVSRQKSEFKMSFLTIHKGGIYNNF